MFVERGEFFCWVVRELLEFLYEREVGRAVIIIMAVGEWTRRRCGGWRRGDWDIER